MSQKNSILEVVGVVDLPLSLLVEVFSKVFIIKAHRSARETRQNCESYKVCIIQNNFP